MCFLPVVLLAPLFRKAENRYAAFTESSPLDIPFRELVLRYDSPPPFRGKRGDPVYVWCAHGEFVPQRDYRMTISLAELVESPSKSWRKVVVDKEIQAASPCS